MTKLRSSKYWINLIEQDRRAVKFRLGDVLGMENFSSATKTIGGIELMHRNRKIQFNLPAEVTQGRTTPKFGLPCSLTLPLSV